jgi:hypothetical protein
LLDFPLPGVFRALFLIDFVPSAPTLDAMGVFSTFFCAEAFKLSLAKGLLISIMGVSGGAGANDTDKEAGPFCEIGLSGMVNSVTMSFSSSWFKELNRTFLGLGDALERNRLLTCRDPEDGVAERRRFRTGVSITRISIIRYLEVIEMASLSLFLWSLIAGVESRQQKFRGV